MNIPRIPQIYCIVNRQGYIMRAYYVRKYADKFAAKCNESAAKEELKASCYVVPVEIHRREYKKRKK